MTVCTQCGTDNLSDAKFCHSCGATLSQYSAGSSPANLTTTAGQVFPLSADSTIGSGSGNAVVLAGPGVDAFHAEIIYNGMDWILYRKSNGEVLLNDQPVGSFGFLRGGDVITIGKTRLTFNLTAAGMLPDLPPLGAAAPPPVPIPGPEQPPVEPAWVPAPNAPQYAPSENQAPPPAAEPVEEDVYNVEKPYPVQPAAAPPTWQNPPSPAPTGSNVYNTPKTGGGYVPSAPYPQTAAGRKNRYVAALLAIFLGSFGAHRFYLGQTWWGIAYLVFFWAYIPGIAGIVEGVMYLMMSDQDFALKYG